MSASQRTKLLACLAPSSTRTRPRYVDSPPSLEIDFDTMVDVVSGATWIILAPASWCWPGPAYATDNTSPDAFGPMRYTDGYFIVSRLLWTMKPSETKLPVPSTSMSHVGTSAPGSPTVTLRISTVSGSAICDRPTCRNQRPLGAAAAWAACRSRSLTRWRSRGSAGKTSVWLPRDLEVEPRISTERSASCSVCRRHGMPSDVSTSAVSSSRGRFTDLMDRNRLPWGAHPSESR